LQVCQPPVDRLFGGIGSLVLVLRFLESLLGLLTDFRGRIRRSVLLVRRDPDLLLNRLQRLGTSFCSCSAAERASAFSTTWCLTSVFQKKV